MKANRHASLALCLAAMAVSPLIPAQTMQTRTVTIDRSAELPANTARAVLGGGCFWCLEAIFARIDGVLRVTSGFAGGDKPDPTYREVVSGDTGHAEVVEIIFDPAKVAYEELLEVFWLAHDPTTLNCQGPDIGTQYRSIILYGGETQKSAAHASVASAAPRFKDPIVTELKPLETFYPAEDYHQDYFENNRRQPYCRYVILPKLEKVHSKLGDG